MDWLVSSFPGENIFTFRKMLRLSVILVHLAKWGGRGSQRVLPYRTESDASDRGVLAISQIGVGHVRGVAGEANAPHSIDHDQPSRASDAAAKQGDRLIRSGLRWLPIRQHLDGATCYHKPQEILTMSRTGDAADAIFRVEASPRNGCITDASSWLEHHTASR